MTTLLLFAGAAVLALTGGAVGFVVGVIATKQLRAKPRPKAQDINELNRRLHDDVRVILDEARGDMRRILGYGTPGANTKHIETLKGHSEIRDEVGVVLFAKKPGEATTYTDLAIADPRTVGDALLMFLTKVGIAQAKQGGPGGFPPEAAAELERIINGIRVTGKPGRA